MYRCKSIDSVQVRSWLRSWTRSWSSTKRMTLTCLILQTTPLSHHKEVRKRERRGALQLEIQKHMKRMIVHHPRQRYEYCSYTPYKAHIWSMCKLGGSIYSVHVPHMHTHMYHACTHTHTHTHTRGGSQFPESTYQSIALVHTGSS